jgi:hypothetical protein
MTMKTDPDKNYLTLDDFTRYTSPNTQKGKGVVALRKELLRVPAYFILRKTLKEILKYDDFILEDSGFRYPLFARPCPITPRHGFVESRIVNNWDEVKQVWIETLEADAEGELMLCYPINAEWNALITPTSLTIGAGNDGATAGKDVIELPLARTPVSLKFREMLNLAEVDIKTADPFIEAVLPFGWRKLYGDSVSSGPVWRLTQLRAGLKVESAQVNYIPRAIECIELIASPLADEPLLEWEMRVDRMTPNTVIYHKGGSLTSHYAIHAMIKEIPFLVAGPMPKCGQPLKQPVQKAKQRNAKEVLRGIALGDLLGRQMGAYNVKTQVITALVGLYNSHVMRGEHSKWIGISAAIFLKLCTMALRGEARHVNKRVSGKRRASRGRVYRSYAKRTLSFHAKHAKKWKHIFKHGRFNSSSIGGKQWALCASGVEELVDAIQQLAAQQTARNVNHLISVLNRTVDLAHNNGWWLNKFTNGEVYDEVQTGFLPTVVECAQILPMIQGLEENVPTQKTDALLKLYRHWKPEEIDGRITLKNPSVNYISHDKMLLEMDSSDSLLGDGRKKTILRVPRELYITAINNWVEKHIEIKQANNESIRVEIAGKPINIEEGK